MGLLVNLAQGIVRRASTRDRATRVYLSPGAEGREYVTAFDMASQVKAYTGWIYVCANKNSTTVAQQTLRLYATRRTSQPKFIVPTKDVPAERMKYLQGHAALQHYLAKADDVKEVLEHPFLDLMKKVNPFIGQFTLFEQTELFLELTGNAYWYIVKNGLGVPQEIWILPSPNMRVVADPQEFIRGYIYLIGMDKEPYEPGEIVHFKFPSPVNAFYGMSPLMAVANAYNINENMNKFENALFTNMGRLDGVLETENDVDDAEFERINKEWQTKFGGVKKAGQTVLLDKGIHYKPLNLAPRELSFLQGRKVTREEIAGAYGVPLSKLTTEDVNRSNAESGDYQYRADTIAPRCRRIDSTLNDFLMPMYADNLFCAFDNPVPDDKEFRLKEREINLRSC